MIAKQFLHLLAILYTILFLLTYLSTAKADNAKSDPNLVANVRVNIKNLQPGQRIAVSWDKHSVWILRRSETDIHNIEKADLRKLAAPKGENLEESLIAIYNPRNPIFPNLLYLEQAPLETNHYRSIRPDIFVLLSQSPVTGCVLSYLPIYTERPPMKSWLGGFFDTCSGRAYDLTGRVFKKGVNGKAWNLYIPPHQYVDDETILIGLGEPPRTLPTKDFAPEIDYNNLDKVSRLHEAAKWGRLDIVSTLIKEGMSVDTPAYNGVSPLLVAIMAGQYDIVSFLLEQGADPNRSNNTGFAPIHGAVATYDTKMIDMLAHKGVDVNQICPTIDCKGTPLNFAINWLIREPELKDIITTLMTWGADPNLRYEGKNAFDWARITNQQHLIPIMLTCPLVITSNFTDKFH